MLWVGPLPYISLYPPPSYTQLQFIPKHLIYKLAPSVAPETRGVNALLLIPGPLWTGLAEGGGK